VRLERRPSLPGHRALHLKHRFPPNRFLSGIQLLKPLWIRKLLGGSDVFLIFQELGGKVLE